MQAEQQSLSSSAERTKRYRQRKRQGVVAVVQCPIYARDVETLVATNRLKPEDDDNRVKITSAIEDLVDDFTEGQLVPKNYSYLFYPRVLLYVVPGTVIYIARFRDNKQIGCKSLL